jgi:Uma2 family endonuclease
MRAGATMYDFGGGEDVGEDRVMQQDTRDTRLTYDDFLLFPDDGLRHEIIDGEHYVTPSPNPRHQLLLGRLHFEIALYLRDHPGRGQVFLSPLDVVFSKWDVVEPDLLFVAADQKEIVTGKNVQGAPALVVEIASPGTRRQDEQIKRQLFDRGGVREYWIVDPDAHVVGVFRRQADGSLAPIVELRHETVLTTPLLPGLEIRLNELFAH